TSAWKDPSRWPKTWAELASRKDEAFIQDPRLSAVGMGWLKAIFVHQLLSLEQSKSLTKKVFPSWSISYSAFLKGGAPLIWSYQSSEAYHRCEEDSQRYRVLPLEEGYPVQQEHVVTAVGAPARESALFMEIVLSEEIQSQIP